MHERVCAGGVGLPTQVVSWVIVWAVMWVMALCAFWCGQRLCSFSSLVCGLPVVSKFSLRKGVLELWSGTDWAPPFWHNFRVNILW